MILIICETCGLPRCYTGVFLGSTRPTSINVRFDCLVQNSLSPIDIGDEEEDEDEETQTGIFSFFSPAFAEM